MDILEQLKRQADQVEVVNMENELTSVGFEANRLKSSQVEKTKGTAVRVVKDGRLGFAASSATLDTESATGKFVTNALESAAYGDAVPIIFPGPQRGPKVATFDQAVTKLSASHLVEMGQEIIELFLQIEPDTQVNVNLERGVQHLSIRNHTGTEVSVKRSPLSMSFVVSRIRGDDVLLIFDTIGTTVWKDDCLTFAQRLGRKLELAKRDASIRSGRMPVLFAPTGALTLGLAPLLGLNGKNVYTGISPMKDRVGEKLFDDKITIIDDPTMDGRFGSAAHDDEGVAHRRNVLVERGVLRGFMYDLKTAAQAGVQSTGNGSRSLFNPPDTAPTNLIFQAGETPVADMIASIDEGLLVENVLGLGQGNAISGAFSNPISLAFKIEKGEIVGRVKDVSIAGNAYDLLKDVTAVSQETEWVYRNFGLPYILLPELNVVAKE